MALLARREAGAELEAGGLVGHSARLSMSRLSLLVDLSSVLTRRVDLDALLESVCARIAMALRAERATLWLVDAERGDLVAKLALGLERPGLRQPAARGIVGHVAETGQALRVNDTRTDRRFDPSTDRLTGFSTTSVVAVPLREREGGPVRGVLQVLNRIEGEFDAEDEQYLVALGTQLALALGLTTLRAADVSHPGLTLRGPLNGVVGRSPVMAEVYRLIALAAQTDATVLLTGETGTGKALLAQAVHDNSGRQGGPFVTLDCTTLPDELVESELFGHERGAFTGADRKVQGRVELAHGGTLLLDEIGDLPLRAQAKLLRFLQERRFERVGGRETQEVDLRVIAATHRDLRSAVKAGTFREDLYYRLKVVQIGIPPLRARGVEEIEILARHFGAQHAARYRRPEPRFAPELLAALGEHTWPGNVRELSHFIESAVALSSEGAFGVDVVPPSWGGKGRTRPTLIDAAPHDVSVPLGLTLDEVMQRYAVATVNAAAGNKTEAARALGIGRNRLGRLTKGGG